MQHNNAVQKIKAVDSVRETINQDGAVLLDIKQGLCFSMNPVGSRIWEMIKKDYALDEIATALENEFQVSRSEIEQDIGVFVDELRKRNLIQSNGSEMQEQGGWITRLMKLRKPDRSS